MKIKRGGRSRAEDEKKIGCSLDNGRRKRKDYTEGDLDGRRHPSSVRISCQRLLPRDSQEKTGNLGLMRKRGEDNIKS